MVVGAGDFGGPVIVVGGGGFGAFVVLGGRDFGGLVVVGSGRGDSSSEQLARARIDNNRIG